MFNRSYIQSHKGHPHYLNDSKVLSLKKQIRFSNEKEDTLRVFRNLLDPTKLKIYLILQKVEEIPVTNLAQILSLSQSAISHALIDLKNLGLVDCRRCGKLICYFLKKDKKTDNILHSLSNFNLA